MVNVVLSFETIDSDLLFYGPDTVNLPFRIRDRGETKLFCIESARPMDTKASRLRFGDGEFKLGYDLLGCKGLLFTEVWSEQSDPWRFQGPC